MRNTRECVHDIAGFPGVVGCIDCTHIKIKNPGGSQAEVFKNRKRWFSLNIQAVGGPNLQLFDIVARWPGSSHDNFIYNSSSVKQRMLSREIEGLLLGDNGFALSPTLMTPFMSPSGSAQEIYNNAHIKTRNTIERAFGIWKRRFPCLQLGLNIKKETAVAVICACAALHNTALQYDDIQFEPDASAPAPLGLQRGAQSFHNPFYGRKLSSKSPYTRDPNHAFEGRRPPAGLELHYGPEVHLHSNERAHYVTRVLI
ncbi:Putative nuclease HARBI1 [Eumeta japonica]|uniref:Nuclease HARBI1 n=1 Tax=Eumeta variegata TaxID=151549 RepID=A0A4C1XCX2_EUMVA|nr:Putative nuclease HARBI1 [Eumeta japonica]